MTVKSVSAVGWLKDINDNFEALAPVDSDIGLGSLRVARFLFDMATVANRAVGAHGTGVTLPAHAIIVGGFYDVNTAFDGGAGATIAISVQSANDILSAVAFDDTGSPLGSAGRKAIVPKANTPESTSVKTTTAKEIVCTVAVDVFTAGKLTGYLYYVEGIASA